MDQAPPGAARSSAGLPGYSRAASINFLVRTLAELLRRFQRFGCGPYAAMKRTMYGRMMGVALGCLEGEEQATKERRCQRRLRAHASG